MPPTPPLTITEDTPPDMLAGSMDLRVVLPSGHSVKMSVERSTPMMDLLVQVTTLNKISTGGHVLQAIGERGILPYKPSTPIGALDTWTIQVVPKSKVQATTVQKKAPLKPLNQQQPFEPTFRLQVHLPRNQLYVTRVSSKTLLSNILHQTCTEKNLDPNKYELRHPADLSQLLSPSCTLADYGLQEVTLVTRSRAPGMGSALSSSDIMALQREEDKRRQQARQQHGTGTGLGLVLNKRSQSSVCEGSVSSDSLGGRSISPARSDESASRSASPPAPSLPPMMAPLPPARPARKRRPAPKPPSCNTGPISNTQQTESNVQAESSSGTVVNGHSGSNNTKTMHVPVSHSRNSSDSSGYHEASVLSESPAEGNQMTENCAVDTLPRREKIMSGQPLQMKVHSGSHGLSRSMSSLTGVGNMAGCQHSASNTSLASSTGQGLKKKKAPPPPPGAGGTKERKQQSSLSLSSTDQDISEPHKKTTSLERHLSGKNSAVGSDHSPDKCSTLPGKMKMSERDYRPVESAGKKSKITAETKTQSPEEGRLDGDQKIPEVEEDTCVPDISKEIPPFHSQTYQDAHDIATTDQSSNKNVAEKQNECLEQLQVPTVETTPETPVELVSKSRSPPVVDAGTPEASAALEHEPTLHIPASKPRICCKVSSLDDVASSAKKRPVPRPRQLSNSSNSISQSTDINSKNIERDKRMQIALAEDRSERGSIGKKRNGENGSVGQTFGVGTTMLMLSQSGADSVSSDSWEWQSVRSQSSADVGQDSDDDLNIGDNDMEMFDMATETSDIVQASNETWMNNTTMKKQLIDSCDDSESLSLVSSVFEYDSEHETSEAPFNLKCPSLERLIRTKGENGCGASKGGILHVVDTDELQEKEIISRNSRGSSTSLQSVDEVSPFSNSMESLIMKPAASRQSWVLEYNSEAEPEEYSQMEPGDQVEEAFRSVTAELETAIKQDEERSALPPPPLSAVSPDDLTVDWEYQLPAPPSAFRDSDSPTLTEGETVMLADSQVFREHSSSPELQPDTSLAGSTIISLQEALDLHLNSVVHRNEVTQINPLFNPIHCEDNTGDNRKPEAVCEVGMEKFKNDSKHAYHLETNSQKHDLTEEELMKPKSLRDQSKVTSTIKSVPRSGEHVNFTITTYQRPLSTDRLFNEDKDSNREHYDNLSTDSLKKPITVFQHHKYSSTSSINSSAASLSRTNSFNSNNNGILKPPDPVLISPVKRSTSYISLVTNPVSHPGNGFQPGSINTSYTGRTTSVGNLAAQTQMDKGDEGVYESWSVRKRTSECDISQDPPEHHQEENKSQTIMEEQKNAQVGQDKVQGSQQQILITEEERARLLALQEQFLQLQEKLLQNSGLMQQQQLLQPQVPTADTPLQSLQVLRSILPQLNKTKVLSDFQATDQQQQKSDSSVLLRSETLPTELNPKDSEDFPNNQSVKQTASVTSNQQNNDEDTSNNNNTGERKRYTYTGPPAINFATWSERPKSQVSIKMDRDYRIGIGQGGRTDEHNKTPARTGMSESKDKISAARSNNTDAVHQSKNDHEEVFAQNKTNGKLNSSQQVTEIEPASLTMRLISHTTASGFRKPVATASSGSTSYIAGETQQCYTSEAKEITRSSTAGLRASSTFQQNDLSRVPIVRAVELKKSFIQQQNMNSSPHSLHSLSTVLNGEEGSGHSDASVVDQRNSTAHHNGGSDADSAQETFAGVNILAKRFSIAGSSSNGPPSFRLSRPSPSYGKFETVDTKGCDNATSSHYNATLSYKSMSSTNLNASNVNMHQDAQLKNGDRKDTRRYTSVIGINNDIDHNLSMLNTQDPASESSRLQSRTSGPSVVRVNGFAAPKQLMPVVKGFQFASTTAVRDISAPLAAKNSNTTNAPHPKVQRSDSTSAIRSWKTVDTTDHPSSTNSGNTKTYMRQNSNESGPEQMVVKITTKSAESEPPPPPPLAVSLRKSVARPRPKTLPAPQLSARDQLMDAIRNFGGRENLKQVCDNRGSSLNIVLIR